MVNFKKYTLAFVFVVACMSLVSCQNNERPQDKIKVDNIYRGNGKFDRDTLYISALNVDTAKNDSLMKHDVLNIGVRSLSKRSFNPYFSESKFDTYIIDAMWEPLMRKGYDGEYYPNILKQLPTVSEDRKRYLFSLREDLYWEDGTRITTKDIDFTYKFLMDSTYSGNFNRDLLNISGWQSYRDGTEDFISGIEIIDDYNFNVSVDNPTVYTFDLLNIYPLSYSNYGQHYYQGGANEIEKIERPFGNGVFKFLGYEENKYLLLEANQLYFKGKSDINNLTFKVIDINNFVNYLRSGEVDMVRGAILNNENIIDVAKAEFLNAYIFPNYDYSFVGINHNNPILNDVNIRKAINLCIDRKRIVNSISEGYLNVLDVPIDSRFYNLFYKSDNETIFFDKNTSTGLLDQAGWAREIDGTRSKENQKLEFKFLLDKDDIFVSKIFPMIKKDFESVGIGVLFDEVDSKTFRTKVYEKFLDYDFCLMSPWFNYESSWLRNFSTNGMNNVYSYSNQELDKILNEISLEFDIEKSKELYTRAHDIIKQDIPVFALFQDKQFDVYNGRILGINSANIFKTFYYDQIILKK